MYKLIDFLEQILLHLYGYLVQIILDILLPQSSQLVYRSIKELYYSNYIGGDDGAPAATASFNNDGTITGSAYTPNYYNYLSNTLLANRYFPTGSDEEIAVISIPFKFIW
jgi:hypothetical protein